MATATEPLSAPEREAADLLRSLTEESVGLKTAISQNAAARRNAISSLREMGWSFRRIGEVIGVSGQRIDSMLRLGEKMRASHNGSEV